MASSVSTVALSTSSPLPSPTVIFTSSRWSFTQGFLVGQATFLVLCGLFIKYVVFEDAERSRQRSAERAKKAVLSTTNVPPPSSSELLEKTGYEMATHASESADWINVLFAEVLQGYRDDLLGSGGEEGARKQVEAWLNPKGAISSWLDPITVTSLSLGKSYPLLSNARIRPADGQGGLRAEVDVDYTDSIHLSLATSLVINFPQPRFAILPVALGVELVGFGGTITMQLHGSPSTMRSDDLKRQVHLSLLPDFHLNLKATSLLGSRAKLQDIPKLEQLVIARLRQAIQDRVVWPRFVAASLPSLVARGREPVVETDQGVVVTAAADVPIIPQEEIPRSGDIPGSRLAQLSSAIPPVSTPSFPGAFGEPMRSGMDTSNAPIASRDSSAHNYSRMSSRTGPTQGGYGSAYSHLQGQDSGAMRYRGEGGGMGQQPLRRVGALNAR
ncbi:hypothetical protein NliqN6_6139 [Naganishia liquefaciens]|uniref:Maintenance of mitochondrial morphology protein 1 n=1 Tax=Naganishia liquefaciens TaxID=104408 RepID=A0A8H3TZ20_9TREE|nr:hypothetical protein NliqN6_6139 [Naganishia liquefaciens]